MNCQNYISLRLIKAGPVSARPPWGWLLTLPLPGILQNCFIKKKKKGVPNGHYFWDLEVCKECGRKCCLFVSRQDHSKPKGSIQSCGPFQSPIEWAKQNHMQYLVCLLDTACNDFPNSCWIVSDKSLDLSYLPPYLVTENLALLHSRFSTQGCRSVIWPLVFLSSYMIL